MRTLAALQALGRRPVEALIALPVSLTKTMRTNLVLGAVVPALENDAHRIQDELSALAGLRARRRLRLFRRRDALQDVDHWHAASW